MPQGEVHTATEGESKGGARISPLLPHPFLVLSCDQAGGGGARYSLDHVDQVTMGRGDGRSARRRAIAGLAQLALEIPGKRLSATHAQMIRVGARWTLEDCRSTNGVHLNGSRVTSATLADGDVFELGRTVFLYREAVATPPGTPSDLARGERLEPSHFPREIAAAGDARAAETSGSEISEEERRDEALRRERVGLLDAHKGNISEVARAMGKTRMQIHRWMKRFDPEPRREK